MLLSKDMNATIAEAFQNAKAKRHEFLTVEHLLLARTWTACDPRLTTTSKKQRRLFPPGTETGKRRQPWASSAFFAARCSMFSPAAARR